MFSDIENKKAEKIIEDGILIDHIMSWYNRRILILV